jgi:hypothetical protein
MDLHDVMNKIGRDDVSVTFGIAPPAEIVGPLNPKSVYYGYAFGYDERNDRFVTASPQPLVTFAFNKYRSDLPPWEKVREFVLASHDDNGRVVEATFIEPGLRGINTTGDLKTVELGAEGPAYGVDGAIIERDEVAEKRGIAHNERDFKVSEDLK